LEASTSKTLVIIANYYHPMKRIFRFILFIAILLLGSQQSHAFVIGAATSEQQPSCQGATDGWVTIDSLITTPPSGPYVIRINTSPVQFFNVGDTVFNLTTQNYIITILDLADNSVAFAPVNFASSGINAAAFSFPASCFGVCDGSASIAIIGGNPPYTYNWDDPSNQTTQNASNLCAGVYRITVSDNNACSVVDSVTVTEPPQILPTVSVTDVSCFGFTDGSATSNPVGGSGTYVNYQWTSSGNNTATENNLAAGTYTVTVTDSDGCTGTETFNVGQPADLSVNFVTVNNDCFGGSAGSITTNVSGGTAPYTYSWDDGPLTQNRNGLAIGTYIVTITDNNACVLVDSASITENSEILINLSVLDSNDCFGDTDGRVNAGISGGTAPYSFDWSESTNGNGANTTINNLAAGTYRITVTDNLGCTKVDSATVTEQPDILITVDNVANPDCNGDANGLIDLTVSGGTPAFTFNWNTTDNTEDLSGLNAGNYILTVTDDNGCTAIFDTTLVDPPVLSFIFDSVSNVSCNGGNDGFARVLATGGTGAYTYNWSNSGNTAAIGSLTVGTYIVTVNDANGCAVVDSVSITEPNVINIVMNSTDASCNGLNDGSAQSSPSGGTPPYTYLWAPNNQTTQNINNLIAGSYTVTVTDQNGCTNSNSVVVGEPTGLTLNISGNDLNCNGDNSGVALANVLGGSPPYTFQWDDPLSQTTNPAVSLAAGTYRLTVTDNNNCPVVDSINLTEPAPLNLNLNTYDVSCGGINDGAAAANVTGGTLPYTFNWGPGNPNGQGTDSIFNLTASNYSLTLTDNNGCSRNLNFTINQLPPVFSLSDSSVNPLCNGGNDGFIGLQISGGVAPFNYNWNPALPNQPNQPGLTAGTYDVTVTDNNGCTNTRSINLSQPAALNVLDSITDESCAPGNDGTIALLVSGGTPTYTYNWNPPLSNSPNQNGLTAGNYDVTITDINGCAINRSYTVNQLGATFTVNLTPIDVTCNGLSDGSILANAIPVGSFYSYNWSDIGIGASLRTSLSPGSYTVTVTDTITGCTVVDSASINEPAAILSNLNITPDGCAGGGSGSVTSNPSGGNGSPYSFNWDTPGGTVSGNSVTNLSAGSYFLTITDNSTCTLLDTFTVGTATSNILPNATVNDASCNGVCDGDISLVPTNGVSPYFFSWSDAPVATPVRTNLCAGNYTVTITGSDNCDTVLTLTVGEPPAISATINTTPDTCVQSVGGARVTAVSNGTPPYTFNWPSGGIAVGDSIRNVSAGNYNLTITDNNGCQVVLPYTIGNDANFAVNLSSTDVSCSDGNDGTVTVNVVGGTSPVTYNWSGGLSGANPTNVRGGFYTITVTDALGCGAVSSITVAQPPRIQFNNISIYDENCIPGNDGAARVFFSGGTPPYNYAWPAPGVAVGDSVNSLPAGNYDLTFSDANGCDTIVNFTIGSAASFTVVINVTNASCNGANDGALNVTTAGASPPLTFNWSDIGNGPANRPNLGAGTYGLTVTDATGCSETAVRQITEADAVQIDNIFVTDESCSPGGDGTATSVVSGGITPYTYAWSSSPATTPGITGLSAGNYDLTVTDQNGCSTTKTYRIGTGSNIVSNDSTRDVSCFGGCDGEIILNPTGGVAPYTYNWAPNSGSTNTLSNLCAGGYLVTITDNLGCSSVDDFIIGQPNDLNAAFSRTTESCSPGNDGTARITVVGGTPNYTFNWGAGNVSSNTNGGYAAGPYDVTVTDANSCTKVFPFTIDPSPAITASASTTPASCGNNDGTINVSVANSTNPLTYDWSDVSIGGADPIGVAAGTYTVTVTDGNGCTDTETVTIITDGNYPLNPTITDASCNGDCDGDITLSPTGGIAPYSYLWGNSSTNFFRAGLCAGDYDVTVTDNTGCSTTGIFTVGEPAPIAANLTANDESCSPGGDGSISSATSGGTAPYTYLWAPGGATTSSINGLSSGTYRLTITDNNGCIVVDSADVNSGSNISLNALVNDVPCNGNCNGNITLAPTGGNAPYTYLWDNNSPNPSRNGLCAGNYDVTVTDNTGCSTVQNFPINEPSLLEANASATDESCTPGNDGTASTSASGGTPPYTYNWAPGGSTTTGLTGLGSGNYTVTVTDNNGCVAVETVSVNSGGSINLGETVVNPTCFGDCNGSITLSPSGGVPPYTYLWDDNSVTFFRTSLCAGDYDVTVTDNFGCSRTETITVTQPDSLQANLSSTPESCTPGSDGTASSMAMGGTAPFTYNWSPAGASTSGLSSITAGTYSLTITDANGCSVIDSVVVNGGGNIQYNETIVDASCNGICDGSISLSPSGGVAPYNYLWGNNSNNSFRTGLCAGSYSVTVTDNSSCTASTTFVVGEPSLLSVNVNSFDESCSPGNDGSASTAVAGGTPPYTYNWAPGGANTPGLSSLSSGTYLVTVTDNNGCTVLDSAVINTGANIDLNETVNNASCNGVCDGSISLAPSGGSAPYTYLWDNNSPDSSRTGLCAGTYDVTVTDNFGCSRIASFLIDEPMMLMANIGSTDESCTPGGDGAATTSASGGTPPYTYNWSPGGASTPNLSSLSSGTYIVTISDNNGCIAIDSTVVDDGGNIILNEVVTDASCNGVCDGDITLSPSGGVAPYGYLWGNNSTNFFRTGLCAGSYDVTVTDNTGCSASRTIIMGEPDPLLANASPTNESCNPGGDGSVSTSASGGTPPYTYNWSFGGAITPGISGLSAGPYSVTITDNNGCVNTETVNVGVAPSFTITSVISDPTCPGAADGSIDQTITGTFTNLQFAWDNSLPATEDQSNLSPGSYNVTVTDQGNSCFDTETYVINPSSTNIDPNLTLQNDACNALALCQGFAVSNPIGGVPPYTFNWTGPNTNVNGVDSIGSLCAGDYTLIVTDANGCDTSVTFTIAPRSLILPNEASTSETCVGQCDGTASVSPSGGVSPYTFAWSNSAGNVSSISGLCSGPYTVTITDAAACDTVLTINVGTTSFSYNINKSNQSCNGGCDGTADFLIPGGSAGYTFNWAPAPGAGQGTPNVTGLCVGPYSVTITEVSSGCSVVDNITINPFSPLLPNEASVNESCAGSCDGVARVNPSGGNPPYTYVWTPTPPNNQQGNSEIRDLCAGNYSVQVLDASSCDTTISFVISPPTAIVGNIVGEDQQCGNSNPCEGKAFVSPTGGTTPYTYNWSLGVTTGVTADTAINLCNGQYFVTITDANGCTVEDSVIIGSPTAIDTSFSVINSTCNTCDGSLKVTPSGGTAPYTYVWTDVNVNQIGATDSVGDLCAGIYFLQITDNVGCTANFARSLSDDGAEILSLSKTDVSCFNGNDGQATVNFVCSDPACSIEWLDGSANPINVNTATASNLSAGTYFVRVTNNTGCISIANVTIGQPSQIIASTSVIDASCSNSCDGSARVNVAGGNTPYTFSWSPAPGGGQGTANATGLCAGIYNLLIQDANGCDTSLSITVGSPAPLSASFTSIDASCNQSDGSITATVGGGTASLDYQYQWFDAANNPIVGQTSATISNLSAGAYILQITDDNNCVANFNAVLNSTNGPTVIVDSVANLNCNGGNDGQIFITVRGANSPFTYNWLNQGQTTQDIGNLSAGFYTVIVTNALGCVSSDTATVQPADELLATISTNDASCGQCNGTANISITGGTAPYTYLWNTGSTLDNASGLCGGVHAVDVTDANGCSKTFNFTISTIEGPSNAIVSATNESCPAAADGSVTVSPVGGTAPYTYQWLHNGANTNSLNNLTAGTYFLLITDAGGCSRNVEVNIGSPIDLEVTPVVTASGCGLTSCNGSIRLNTSAGNQPYTYNWQFAPSSDTNFLGGLCAGIYQVTVSDANGCTKSLNINLPNDGNPIIPSPSVTNLSCFGSCDGSLVSNLNPSASLTYRWLDSQGTAIAPADADLNNAVCAGEYVLEVTTLPEGCISYTSVEVEEADSILLGASIVNNISCNGECDGEIYISTTGGNILYTYSWDDPSGQDGVPASNLCAGTYSVTATDANGCTATTTVNLVEPPPLIVSLNSASVLDCSSDCDASADVTANGGTAPYTFNWDGGQSGSTPNDLCFGPNVLTVTDATGCTEQLTVNVAAIDTVIAQVPADTLFCDGDSIRLTATLSGSTISSFGWYLGDTTTLFSNSADTTILRPVGSYNFFLIASNGNCNDTTVYTPTVVTNPLLQVPAAINIYKDEVANIRIDGEQVSYLYNWVPAEGLNDSTLAEPTATIEESKTYVLTVTDTNGCNFIDSVQVIYNEELDIPSGISPNGDGKNDVWRISVLEEFPNAKVQVFNRWGELLFEQDNGYKVPWDGTYKGKALPVGTYYFVIDLKSDRFETITGPITIVK